MSNVPPIPPRNAEHHAALDRAISLTHQLQREGREPVTMQERAAADIFRLFEHYFNETGTREVWSAGWNVPGYLPDDPARHFETWEWAAAYLDDELERAADDTAPEVFDQYAQARQVLELSCATPEETHTHFKDSFCTRVGNHVWWIQRVHIPLADLNL